MKRFLLVSALAALALVLAGSVSAGTQSVSLTIRHQVRGCHTWAVGNGPYKAAQTVKLARGVTLLVTNNDVMPHQLIRLAGPTVHMQNLAAPAMHRGLRGPFAPGIMGRIGAGTKLVFTHPGTYRFTTKAGEDYMEGMKTVGEDNVLELTVIVS